MKIHEWLQEENITQRELAKRLGLNEALVSLWVRGLRQVPWNHCIRIEEMSGGRVKCEELRPDLAHEWRILRRRLDAA